MIKKIILFSLILSLAACGGSKVRTSKPVSSNKKSTASGNKSKSVSNHSNGNKASSGEILVATSKVKATTEDVEKYIEDFKETAKSNMKQHGIPASIIMAQGILESLAVDDEFYHAPNIGSDSQFNFTRCVYRDWETKKTGRTWIGIVVPIVGIKNDESVACRFALDG